MTPPNVSTHFDFNKPVQFDFRFKFSDPITVGEDSEFRREILSTGVSEGFSVVAEYERGTAWIGFGLGDGSGAKDYGKILIYIDPYSWQAMSIIFRLADDTPRVDFVINGTSSSILVGSSDEGMADLSKIMTFLSDGEYTSNNRGLDKVQIFAGGFPEVDLGAADPRAHNSTLIFDYLHILSQKTDSNSGYLSDL